MRVRLAVVLSALALLAAATAVAAPGGAGTPVANAENPCESAEARQLLCPDLRVGPAADLYLERRGGGEGHNEGSEYYASGRGALLHAANDIKSRGLGPMELRGQKYKPGWMRANQVIYRRGGGFEVFETEARFHFYDVGPRWGGSYWKVHDPLSMEIWSLDESGRPAERVRKGPKVFYCFRDLERTRPGKRSPKRRHYGACSQDPGRQRLTLGTSVGWSDIYPADYDRQWVSVAGLRGCYSFVMRVDPENLLYESNERNNRSSRVIRLPYRNGPQHC